MVSVRMRQLSLVISWAFFCGFLSVGANLSYARQEIQPTSPSKPPVHASTREALARQILEDVGHSTPSTVDTLPVVLYRSAGAWMPIDPSRAISLYQEAFSFARGSTMSVRAPLETAILNELLPLSPSEVANLVRGTDTDTESYISAGLIVYWLYHGDYPRAVAAFDGALADGILVADQPTLHLLTSLPAKDSDLRNHVFKELVAYCKSHSTNYSRLDSWTDRFYKQLPADLVRDAIHTGLVEAEMDAWQHPTRRISIDSVPFSSTYDVELLRIAPALLKVDPDQAHNLMAEHPDLAENIQRFPKGFESLAPQDFYFNYLIRPSHDKQADLRLWTDPSDPLNLQAQDLGLELARGSPFQDVTGSGFPSYDPQGPEASVIAQGDDCRPDIARRLEQLAQPVPMTRQVPVICTEHGCAYRNGYPRVELFEFFAHGCILGAPSAARAILSAVTPMLNQIPEQDRVPFVAQTADLYLRAGDRDTAADVLKQGFDLARAAYQRDAASETFQKFSPVFWPSAEIYREIVTVGTYASVEETRTAVDEIPDRGLQSLEKTMIARALLGVPVRRRIMLNASGSLEED